MWYKVAEWHAAMEKQEACALSHFEAGREWFSTHLEEYFTPAAGEDCLADPDG